jgi:hypothetical protein
MLCCYGGADHFDQASAKGKRNTGFVRYQKGRGTDPGRQAFHEFVLAGNEPSLRQYYEANRTEESQMIAGANVFACIGSATSIRRIWSLESAA